jgi:hypothetical protein
VVQSVENGVCDIFPDASVRGVEINRTVAPGMPASVAPSITFTVSVTVAARIGSTIANNARNPRSATFTALCSPQIRIAQSPRIRGQVTTPSGSQ